MSHDGGNFPEIDLTQYQLKMANSEDKISNAIPLGVNDDGKTKFDRILKQNVKVNKVSSVFLHRST
jgi:hypothetical protein